MYNPSAEEMSLRQYSCPYCPALFRKAINFFYINHVKEQEYCIRCRRSNLRMTLPNMLEVLENVNIDSDVDKRITFPRIYFYFFIFLAG